MPKISVIMPAYNAEKYIKEAIESILNQTFKDFEFIIINDGSIDSTKNIIERYSDSRIKLINHNNNRGVFVSRNEGLRIAKGEFIANFDSDDISLDNRLEEQLNFMKANPDIAVVGTWLEIIDIEIGNNYILKYNSDPVRIKWEQIIKNQIPNPASFLRRKILDDIGYYNEKYRYAGDYDFWSRIIRKYKTSNIPKVLVKQRAHKESITGAPETHRLQQKFVSEIIFNNVKYYINLNQNDFDIFIAAVKNGMVLNFSGLMKVRKIYKDLFNAYIKKENIDKEEVKKILPDYPDYKKKRRAMLIWYIKYKFPKIYNLCKNLFKFK